MRKNRIKYIKNTFLPCVASGLAVGLIVGTAVFFFRWAADLLTAGSAEIYAWVYAHPLFAPLLFLGLAILAAAEYFLQLYSPESRGGGIPRSVGAVRGVLSFRWLRSAVGAVFNSFISFFAGLPLGTEGSSVLLGTALGKGASRLPLAKRNFSKYTMTGGASAGFAVATGAPLAGIVFAVEEMHRKIAPTMVLAVVSAVLSATLVSSLLSLALGMEAGPLFALSAPVPDTFALQDIWILLLAGLFSGLAAAAFCRLLDAISRFYGRHPSKKLRFARFVALFCLIGLIGLFLNDALYGGHGLIENLLALEYGAGLMFALFALRFLLIALSSGDGATGGLFIPMLSLGALVGGLTAKLCVAMGMSESYAPLTVLLCTVSFLGAATKSPVTAIVLAVETTWQFTNLFFAAAAVFTAYFVMSLLRGESAYESMLKNMLKKEYKDKTCRSADIEIVVRGGCFAEGKPVSDLLFSVNLIPRRVFSAEREEEVFPGRERGLRAGDKLVFTAVSYDFKEAEEELVNYFGPQEAVWKEN